MNRFVAALAAVIAVGPAHAAVTVAELRQTCRTALANGYQGVDAAMCDWWVRPCAVCGVEAQAVNWCIPAGVDNAMLAALVVKELDTAPEAGDEVAREKVEKILRAHYPCAAQDGSNG